MGSRKMASCGAGSELEIALCVALCSTGIFAWVTREESIKLSSALESTRRRDGVKGPQNVGLNLHA